MWKEDGTPKPTSAEDFIELMDACGIDQAFYISWSPEDIPSDLSRKGIPAESVRETMNVTYPLDAMQRCGERFYWFPCHLGPAVPDHMAQARRNLEAGAAGLKLVTSFWGEIADDPRCRRIIALAAEFEAPVIIDTSFWYLGIDEPEPLEAIAPGHREVRPRVRDWEDYAGHLRRTFESFPSINISLAHAGARTFTPEHAAEAGALIAEYPHVYADLGALDPGSPALEALVEAAGPDRVMFGTDWPHFAQGDDMAATDRRRAGARQVQRRNGGSHPRRQRPRLHEGRPAGADSAAMSDAARAEDLHRSSPVFVGHDHYCDEEHLLAMHRAGLAGKVTLASVDARVFSDIEDRERSLHEYTGFTEPAWQEMRSIRAIVDAHPDALLLARGAEGHRARPRDGRSAVLLGFEGGKPIERDLGLLHEAYGLGLRVLQLTWAGGNDICDRRDPPVCEGLTDFGKEAVREMNRLGVLVDPGHCSRKTFFQVMELSTRPVAFLHGTPRGAIPGAGDLDDDQLRAVAATGGVVGLHFFSHYLHPARPATAADLVTHVEYLAEAIGLERIALGCDYLHLSDDFRRAHGLPASGYLGIPEELDGYDKLVNVTRELCRRGFGDEEIRGILGGNLIRLFRAVIR